MAWVAATLVGLVLAVALSAGIAWLARRMRVQRIATFEPSRVSVRALEVADDEIEPIELADAPNALSAVHVHEHAPEVPFDYDHVLYSVAAGNATFVARRYDTRPREVAFLRREVAGRGGFIARRDLGAPSMREAIRWFRAHGMKVYWLSERGYRRIWF